MHRLAVVVAPFVLAAQLAFADPAFQVRYPNGIPQVSIAGSYPGASYAVWRAGASGGAFQRITDESVLCLDACAAYDLAADPGATYLYRFDLIVPDGGSSQSVSYGPYRATISPALARALGVFAFPNPGHGATTVQLHVADPGAGVAAEASIFDLAGRRLRQVHRGPLTQRLTTLTWDGRDERGTPLGAGVYVLRLAAGGRTASCRLVRR